MKIYVAHNFAARLQLREDLKELAKDHEITSRWIYDDEHVTGKPEECALVDIEDILRADALLLFVDQFGNRGGRGKWFEWGFAYGSGKDIILVGEDKGCVFYHLKDLRVSRFDKLETLVEVLNI